MELHLHAEVKGTLKVRVESTTPVAAPEAPAAADSKRDAPHTEKRGRRTDTVEVAADKGNPPKTDKAAKPVERKPRTEKAKAG